MLTAESLMRDINEAMRKVERIPVQPRIIFTSNALEETNIRLFPESRNRSKRIHKKLIRRFGSEFRKVPCMWRVGDVIYAHPAIKPRLDAAFPPADSNTAARGAT